MTTHLITALVASTTIFWTWVNVHLKMGVTMVNYSTIALALGYVRPICFTSKDSVCLLVMMALSPTNSEDVSGDGSTSAIETGFSLKGSACHHAKMDIIPTTTP